MNAPTFTGCDREWRIFGPPGTGKTTRLVNDLVRAVAKHGPFKVIVGSYSRTAAQAIVRKAEAVHGKLPIPRENVGTLHALAYRALGRPPIAETGDLLAEWNKRKGVNSPYAISDSSRSIDCPFDSREMRHARRRAGISAEGMLADCSTLRARMVPTLMWPRSIVLFYEAWTAFKRETNSIDFTDMIERALEQCPYAPGSPLVGFFDEVQDFSALELALVRSWGSRMYQVILSGDDDQTIYAWRGADPKAFIGPEIAAERKIVLPISYRLPERIKSFATRVISHVKSRETKVYQSRCDGGVIRELQTEYHAPATLYTDLERQMANGRNVMVIASCAYMLRSLLDLLREQGVPFCNYYRPENGEWNPLRGNIDRVESFLAASKDIHGDHARRWTWGDIQAWSELVDFKRMNGDKGLAKGARTFIRDLEGDALNVTPDDIDLCAFFQGDMPTPNVDWYISHLRSSLTVTRRKNLTYAAKVAAERAKRAFRLELNPTFDPSSPSASPSCDMKDGRKDPTCVVGTIHSVKGGEADVVYVIPDLSVQGGEQFGSVAGAASLRRLFYVACTRAREELVLCTRSRHSIDSSLPAAYDHYLRRDLNAERAMVPS